MTHGFDTCRSITLGSQNQRTDHAVAPTGSSGIDGNDIVALSSNIKLKRLLCHTTKTITGSITNVDGRRVGRADDSSTRTSLYSKLQWSKGGNVPVAGLVLQCIMTGSKAECSTGISQAILNPSRMLTATNITEIETVVEGTGITCQLHHTATSFVTIAIAHAFLFAVVGCPPCWNTGVLREFLRQAHRLRCRQRYSGSDRCCLTVVVGSHHLQCMGTRLGTRQCGLIGL